MKKSMKMSELIERLKEKGFPHVTEKMIRHYIEKGLLPQPERPAKNQALYTEDFIYLFSLIEFNKNKGLSLGQIKQKLTNEKYLDVSSHNNTYEDHFFTFAFEQIECEENWDNLEKKFEVVNKKELISRKRVNEEILNFAIRNNFLKSKDLYDNAEIHFLKCIEFFLKVRDRHKLDDVTHDEQLNIDQGLYDTIKEASELAEKVARFSVSGIGTAWIYPQLFKSMLFLKARDITYHAFEGSEQSTWLWDDKRIFPYEEALSFTERNIEDVGYWFNYLEYLRQDGRNLMPADILGDR